MGPWSSWWREPAVDSPMEVGALLPYQLIFHQPPPLRTCGTLPCPITPSHHPHGLRLRTPQPELQVVPCVQERFWGEASVIGEVEEGALLACLQVPRCSVDARRGGTVPARPPNATENLQTGWAPYRPRLSPARTATAT